MIPKQKAIQLYNKFNKEITESSSSYEYEKIKEVSPQIIDCCLVAVDEILEILQVKIKDLDLIEFWQEIKNEINKL